ncbi:MAG: exonuclease SbcCD subunit D, partial [Oscillospiraceae bacterium]
MKIVHTADWHIGKNLNDYSLLEDQKHYFQHFIKKLEQIKPDALIIAGDLYDRSIPSSEAINLLGNILCEIVLTNKIQTFIVAGNHDSKERLSFGSELLQKSGLHIVGNIEKEIKKVIFQDINFYLIPYIEPHNVKQLYPDQIVKTHDQAMKLYTKEMLEKIDTDKINILVGHGLYGYGTSSDVSVGGSELIDCSIFENFDYVALGHLHSRRTAGSKKMIFSGSPLKYSIDEANQNKSFTLINIMDKHTIETSQILIEPLRDVRILEGSFDYLNNRDNFNRL